MPEDFQIRHRRLLSISQSFNEIKPDLMADLRLARQAGRVIGPILSRFHLSTNFSDPAHCRVIGGELILIVGSASQENRIRQLKGRLLKELALAKLPITDISVHIVVQESPAQETQPPAPPLPRSVVGATAIASALGNIQDDRLRETLARLSAAIAPSPEAFREEVEKRITERSLKIAEENFSLQAALQRKNTEFASQQLEEGATLNAEALSAFKAIAARLQQTRERIRAEIEAIKAKLTHNTRALTLLSEASACVKEDPAKAASYLAQIDEPPAEKPPEALVTFAPSIKGAMAVEALLKETESYALRRSLQKLRNVLTPTSHEYAEALKRSISEEMGVIEAQLAAAPKSPAGTERERDRATEARVQLNVRLRQLCDGLTALSMHLRTADEVAQELYQFSLDEESEAASTGTPAAPKPTTAES